MYLLLMMKRNGSGTQVTASSLTMTGNPPQEVMEPNGAIPLKGRAGSTPCLLDLWLQIDAGGSRGRRARAQ